MKKFNVISLISLVVLCLTSCNTKMSISPDILISSGKLCGVYSNVQNSCLEFSPKEITVYSGEKKQVIFVKYEKVNDSIMYFYPLSGGNRGEVLLKSKDIIIMDGGLFDNEWLYISRVKV